MRCRSRRVGPGRSAIGRWWVLTAAEVLTMPGVSAEGNAAMRRIWLELHEELAELSTNSDHRIVEGAGH